ncbi:hypothetical protein [Radiobacillus sp. PE A8.2]|uniref:hypothetical protein n=1 Tax=Radiobacillus sp. PE A8.2 TaxID=3380349 RepID=UPI00388D5CF7
MGATILFIKESNRFSIVNKGSMLIFYDSQEVLKLKIQGEILDEYHGGENMPVAGDSFITTLKQPHLEWGVYRYTSSRGIIYGEGYLQIPIYEAKRLSIYNSNHPGAIYNYNCNSKDGYLKNVILKASGSTTAGDVYAKQFQGSGNLQLIGDWFDHVHAKIGDIVRITWTSRSDIEIEKI